MPEISLPSPAFWGDRTRPQGSASVKSIEAEQLKDNKGSRVNRPDTLTPSFIEFSKFLYRIDASIAAAFDDTRILPEGR
jgi:hypothetical protein